MSLLTRILKEEVEIVHIESLALKLMGRERKCRIEISVQTTLCPHRDLPYTEEAEDMVDTECIKIFSHLCKTRLPPCEAVLRHLLPVVGRESPVLSVSRECIRRCTCLRIHMEEFRIKPCIHAGTADSDRKVSLEDHTLRMCIGTHL